MSLLWLRKTVNSVHMLKDCLLSDLMQIQLLFCATNMLCICFLNGGLKTQHLHYIRIFNHFFIFLILEDISPFCADHWYLFWTSNDSCLGFQSQGGSLSACIVCAFWMVDHYRYTSSVTSVDFIEVSMTAEPFQSMFW